MKSRTFAIASGFCAVLAATVATLPHPAAAQDSVPGNLPPTAPKPTPAKPAPQTAPPTMPPAPADDTAPTGTGNVAQAQIAFQNGFNAYKAGDLVTAETELAISVAADPVNADANGWYGFILLKRNKPAAAVPYLEKATTLKPDGAEHFTNLGNALLLKPGRTPADTNRALEAFKKVIMLSPESSDALFNLGFAYTRVGRYREAIPVYKRATELNPKDDRSFLALGQEHARANDFDNAAKAYRAASALTPQKADVWTNLGIAESKRRQPDRQAAINALETARKLDGGTPQTLMLLGRIYAQAGKTAESSEAFTAAAELLEGASGADVAMIRYNQGVMYARDGKTTEALAAYDKALSLKPDYFEAAFNAATLHFKNGRYADATRLFDVATKANPQSSTAWTNYGVSLLRQNDELGAIAAWKRAADLKPDDYLVRDQLAGLYTRRKSYDDAIAIYRQNTRIRLTSPVPWNALGLAQQKKGDYEGALVSFQTAIKRDANYAPAHNNLGVVYEKRAQFKQAVAAYKKALAVDPGFADARANLARYTASASAAKP